MRQCPFCNAELAEGVQVCPNCGRNLAVAPAQHTVGPGSSDLSPPEQEGDGKQQTAEDVGALPILGTLAGQAQAPAASVTTVEGTPQASEVPTVQGTSSPPAEHIKGEVEPVHKHSAAQQAGEPQHLHTTATRGPLAHTQAGLRPIRQSGRVTTRWVIGSGATLVVIAVILAALIALRSPALSLSGNTTVTPGSILHLHGSGFLPSGNVTFTLDHHQQLPVVQTSRIQQDFSRGGATILQVLAAEGYGSGYRSPDTLTVRHVPILTSEFIQVGLDGSFDVETTVSSSWSP